MRSRLVVAGIVAAAMAAAACSKSTGPKTRSVQHLGWIGHISVPARAAVTDTVKIVFSYSTQYCDTGTVLQSRTTSDGMRFTVTSWSTDRPCPAVTSVVNPVLPMAGYIVTPPHVAPMRLVFSEPDGNDSTRVVQP